MDARKAILYCIEQSGKSRIAVAKQIGRSPNYFSSHAADPPSPRADVLAEAIDACGYDLLMRNRATGEEVKIDPPTS